jgi:signal transduction histidine kinase
MWFLKKSANASSDDEPAMPAHVVALMPTGFCYFNINGAFDASPAFLKLFGISTFPKNLDALMESLPSRVVDKLQPWLNGLSASIPHKMMLLDFTESEHASKSAREIELSAHWIAPLAGDVEARIIWAYDVSEHRRDIQPLKLENAKLKADVQQYSTILNMAPYPIWGRGEDLNLRYCNLRYSEMVEDIAAREGDGIMPDIDRKARLLAANALKDGKAKSDRRHIVVNGARRFYQLDELPIVEQQMVVGFGQDLSEFETLQEELKRYMSAQSDLLESSASAMAIYGPDMRLKSFNYAFVALWKLDEAWLDSQPTYSEILEMLRENRKLPEQANFQMFKQQQLRLFTELMEPREEFFYLPDGKTLRVIAITHALGGILFAYEDVTDRLALERSYNTLIAVQRETLDNLHEGVAVFGEDGRLKLSNPVYLSMWNIPQEFAANEPHIRDVIEHSKQYYIFDDWEKFKEDRIANIQTRQASKYRIDRRDGKVIQCSIVPLPDGATLINFIDVTDSTLVERSLRERNDALQDADRVKTEFLANVSYELRSPLTSIAGFSDMLRQQYFGDLTAKQREYVDGIYQSSQHLMELVDDILDLASIEAGYMQLERAPFDVYAMLVSTKAMVSERAKRQELTLTMKCKKDIGMFEGDQKRIKQCLLNLLSNAIRFCQAGGKVLLGAELVADGASIRLYVEDNGPGIPAEELPHIFNKFYKGKNEAIPKSKSKSGTGLGLSMVKNFIEMHGGKIEVESTSGRTRFTCVLPINER